MQQRPVQVLMVEPCDICGDVGYHEVIVTCSKCNINREHAYCMRVCITDIPDDWLCEACQPRDGTTSPCKVNQDFNLQASKRQRPVKIGKVKYLPEDEAIKLTSGNVPTKPIRGSYTFMTPRKASVASKTVISKIPSRTSPMELSKLPRNGAEKYQMTDQRASHSVSKGEISSAVAECDRSNIGKSDIWSIQETFNLHRGSLPSLRPTWKGRFKIRRPAASSEFHDMFEAHPPCVVNRNAYKLSTKMPLVLQLEPLPALNILTDVFQDDSPTLEDIALYFFPSNNTERSRESFNSVFEFMNAKHSILRTSVDGVELLVFTSNLFNMESKVTAGYFLWGVFRQNKTAEAVERIPDMEPVDMVIDMIGGVDVAGTIDLVYKPRNLADNLDIPPGFESTLKNMSLKLQ